MDRLILRNGYPLLVIQYLIVSLFSPLQSLPHLGPDWSLPQQSVLAEPARVTSSPVLDSQVVDANINRPPVLLQLLIFLFGNDWLGADWLYLGFAGNFSDPKDIDQGNVNKSQDTSTETSQSKLPRFWTDPGPALIKPGDALWVWGFDVGSYNVSADSLLVNPPADVASPDEVLVFGKVLTVEKESIDVLDIRGLRYTVLVDEFTSYTLLPGGEAEPRPEQGIWLNISWLTGNVGMLGPYAHFHGSCRGFLRLDFMCL